jgi:hypothetical protein
MQYCKSKQPDPVGHTVPSPDTLAKYAQALEIPMYRRFCDGDAELKEIKALTLDREAMSLSERREIETFGRSSLS